MEGWIDDGWYRRYKDRWVDTWKNRQMDGWMDGKMNEDRGMTQTGI